MGESEFTRPFLDAPHQVLTIKLSVVLLHDPIVKTLHWHSEAETEAFTHALARQPALRQAFITLDGNLGAGKTTLVRHLLRALGVVGRIKSPTYAVVEPYALASCNAWHFDFYRFNDPREWEDAGFRDIFASPGLKLAEWPEKAAAVLPVADLCIHLQADADATRHVQLTAHTPTGVALLNGIESATPSGAPE